MNNIRSRKKGNSHSQARQKGKDLINLSYLKHKRNKKRGRGRGGRKKGEGREEAGRVVFETLNMRKLSKAILQKGKQTR